MIQNCSSHTKAANDVLASNPKVTVGVGRIFVPKALT